MGLLGVRNSCNIIVTCSETAQGWEASEEAGTAAPKLALTWLPALNMDSTFLSGGRA